MGIIFSTILAMIIVLILALASSSGIIDCIAFHDDAIAAATAGRNGGTAITSALILDDDGKIDEDSQGRLPTLMAVIAAEFDVLTDELVGNGWWSLQPNKWPNTRRIGGNVDWVASELTDSAAATHHPSLPKQLWINQMFDIPLTKDLDWISSNSKLAGTIINADMALIWVYSYGPRYPMGPNPRLHRIMKVADGAMAAADVFDDAWSAQLTGVTPGLDETKDYIIRGVIYEPAAKDKLSALVRVGTQKGEYKMIGVGPGNMLQRVETIFPFDGIPIHGLTGLTAEHLGGATDTPWAGVILEEIGESYTIRVQTPTAQPMLPAGTPRPAGGYGGGASSVSLLGGQGRAVAPTGGQLMEMGGLVKSAMSLMGGRF